MSFFVATITFYLLFSGCSNEFEIELQKDVYIETAIDGSGTQVSSLSLIESQSTSLYAIERDQDGEFLQAVDANWSIESGASLTTASTTEESSGVELTAEEAGTIELVMKYKSFGKKVQIDIEGIPSPPRIDFTTSDGQSIQSRETSIVGDCTGENQVTISGEVESEITVNCENGSFLANVRLTSGDGSKNLVASQTDQFDQTTTTSIQLVMTTENERMWDLSSASDYLLNAVDELYIDFVGGNAVLKAIDQSYDSINEFQSGEFYGVYLDSNGQLTLQDETIASTPLDQILPSRASNLVTYLNFEGNYLDSTAFGNDGVTSGNISLGVAKVGNQAMSVGSPASLNLGNDSSLHISGDITVQAWVRTTNSANKVIAGKLDFSGRGFLLTTSTGGTIRFNGQDQNGIRSSEDSSTSIADGRWHHVVGQRDGSVWKIYLNGILESSSDAADTSSISNTNSDLVLGSILGVSQYNGQIDEFAIWNVALTEEEIATVYNTQKGSSAEKELHPFWTPQYDRLSLYIPFEGSSVSYTDSNLIASGQGAASLSTSSKIGREAADLGTPGDHYVLGASSTSFKFAAGQDFTVSAWINTTKATETPAFVSNESSVDNTGFTLGFTGATGLPYFTVQDSCCASAEGTTAINDGEWHHLAGVRIGDTAYLYVNGLLEATMSGANVSIAAAQDLFIGTDPLVDWDMEGLIDDVAIWSVGLTEQEIKTLYQRQTRPHNGTYISGVMDISTSGTWESLVPSIDLPYGKELSVNGAESGYVNQSAKMLNAGLISYWRFNEGSWSGSSGEVTEATGLGGEGLRVGDAQSQQFGILGKSAHFDGNGDHLIIDDNASYALGTGDFAIAAWVKSNSLQNGTILSKGTAANGQFSIALKNSDPYVEIFTQAPGAGAIAQTTTMSINIHDKDWHHIVAMRSGGRLQIFIDGQVQSDEAAVAQDASNSNNIFIGDREALDQPFDGQIDELAMWNRTLSSDEILELYQRGAIQVSYAVRSCADEACECHTIASGGSSADCDGDVLVNSYDTDDPNRAVWLGSNGSTFEFSEDQNCSSPDGTGNCSSVQSEAPSFDFSKFPAASQPKNNRYFQFRVSMSALENMSCSSTRCLPKLTSVSLGPSPRYYAGVPVIESKDAISYSKIISIDFAQSGGCTAKYQLSNDNGSNYYYWDGFDWAEVSGTATSESSTAAEIKSHISSFSDLGAGNLKFRSLMISDSTQDCELEQIQVVIQD